MQGLANRTAIITGGATGIGLAIAEKLVAQGMSVALVSRRGDKLEEVAKDLTARSAATVIAVPCDIRISSDVNAAVAHVAGRFGRIDVLVNNAGLGVTSRIEDCTDDEWDLVLDTNLKGTFYMTRAVLPHMRRRKEGFVLNVASQAAMHGYAEAGPYCASKYGVVGFSEALQKEVKDDGILVHSLCPALVQVPAPKTAEDRRGDVLQAEDVAAAALFVLSMPPHVRIQNIGLHNAGWSPD